MDFFNIKLQTAVMNIESTYYRAKTEHEKMSIKAIFGVNKYFQVRHSKILCKESDSNECDKRRTHFF